MTILILREVDNSGKVEVDEVETWKELKSYGFCKLLGF